MSWRPARFVAARYSTPGAIVAPRAILWHMAEGGGTVSYLTHPRSDNSSHFVVELDGDVVQMVALGDAAHSAHVAIDDNDDDASDCNGTYSAAVARAVLGAGFADINRYCIAVEVEGFAADGPNAVQTVAMVELASYLRRARPTIRGNIGHRDVQDYKRCPGCRFPWRAIGGHGLFGGDDMGLKVTILDPAARGVLRLPDGQGAAGIDLATGLPVTIPGGSVRRVYFTARRTDPNGTGYVIGNATTAPTFVGLSQVPDGAFTPEGAELPADIAAALDERDREWRTFLLAGSPGEL